MKNDMRATAANATYTGGGIYCYHGKLASGKYFVADDESYPYLVLTDEDPKDYPGGEWEPDWETATEVADPEAWCDMLAWILCHKPDGNHDCSEIRRRWEAHMMEAVKDKAVGVMRRFAEDCYDAKYDNGTTIEEKGKASAAMLAVYVAFRDTGLLTGEEYKAIRREARRAALDENEEVI